MGNLITNINLNHVLKKKIKRFDLSLKLVKKKKKITIHVG